MHLQWSGVMRDFLETHCMYAAPPAAVDPQPCKALSPLPQPYKTLRRCLSITHMRGRIKSIKIYDSWLLISFPSHLLYTIPDFHDTLNPSHKVMQPPPQIGQWQLPLQQGADTMLTVNSPLETSLPGSVGLLPHWLQPARREMLADWVRDAGAIRLTVVD